MALVWGEIVEQSGWVLDDETTAETLCTLLTDELIGSDRRGHRGSASHVIFTFNTKVASPKEEITAECDLDAFLKHILAHAEMTRSGFHVTAEVFTGIRSEV